MGCDRAVEKSERGTAHALPMPQRGSARTMQLITSGEYGLYLFPGRRNTMMAVTFLDALLYGGVLIFCVMGVWAWSQGCDS